MILTWVKGDLIQLFSWVCIVSNRNMFDWLGDGPTWIELWAFKSFLENFVVDILRCDLWTTVVLVFLAKAFCLFDDSHFDQLRTSEVFLGSRWVLHLSHHFNWFEVLHEFQATEGLLWLMNILFVVLYTTDPLIMTSPLHLLCQDGVRLFADAHISLYLNASTSKLGHVRTIGKARFSGLLHRVTVAFCCLNSSTLICSFGLLNSERHNSV